jgi:site-specific DNA-methyltransferase (adenine-specific)
MCVIHCYLSVKKDFMTEPNIEILNQDCLLYMKQCVDDQFDLAIVDPPYGIGADYQKESYSQGKNGEGKRHRKQWDKKGWDDNIPSKEYFTELKRISKNQIVWGGNYFLQNLENTRCFLSWDKNVIKDPFIKIHPTQKPIKLYEWILKNFAQKGDKIIDTHLGSGSIAIACYNYGFDLVGLEIDKEYYTKANKRIEHRKNTPTLF